MERNNLIKMYDEIMQNGGASFQIVTGKLNPQSGFMVALPGYELQVDVPAELNKWQDIALGYLIKDGKLALMEDNTDLYFGAWIDGDKLFLDVSENVPDFDTAEKLGIERKQIAIFDCANQQSFYL